MPRRSAAPRSKSCSPSSEQSWKARSIGPTPQKALAAVGFGLTGMQDSRRICRTGSLRDTMGKAIRLLPMGTWRRSSLKLGSCPSIATLGNEPRSATITLAQQIATGLIATIQPPWPRRRPGAERPRGIIYGPASIRRQVWRAETRSDSGRDRGRFLEVDRFDRRQIKTGPFDLSCGCLVATSIQSRLIAPPKSLEAGSSMARQARQ